MKAGHSKKGWYIINHHPKLAEKIVYHHGDLSKLKDEDKKLLQEINNKFKNEK